jgi:hypothetical protein
MNELELIQEISKKDFDIDKLTRLAIEDSLSRAEIAHQLLTNPNIMVYYHCFYVVSKASMERPDIFYMYWKEFSELLNHRNSYHRDIGLTLIANLTRVDQKELFLDLFDAYFKHINDEKFMTARCCVQNSIKILKNKPILKEMVLQVLLDVDNRCKYPEKQVALLKSDVLKILDELFQDIGYKKEVKDFIGTCLSSISPKTKSIARVLSTKYVN